MKASFIFPGRFFLFLAFAFSSGEGFSQDLDSLGAVRQVDSLLKVSRDFTTKRDFVKALEVIDVAKKTALEKLGRESAAYGSCCFNYGRVFYFKGNHFESEKWYLESKSIREKVLGKEHPDYAWSLSNLALLYLGMGNYEMAEPLYFEAKSIREKVLGKEHPDYAASLSNLANLYWAMGNYEKTEPLYLEAMAIREKVLGKEHPDYAVSLYNLANLYKVKGNHEKAELLHLDSKAIREKVLGKEHPDYARSLNNLADLYRAMGNYEKSESLHLEAKAIREKVLGKEHPDFAVSMSNLAALYHTMGNYEKAESLQVEAKAIQEKVLGKENPYYAASLNNLAAIYHTMGNYEKAEQLYLEAKSIREKVLGKEHPDFAMSLSNLSALYHNMGNYEKAEPLFLEAQAIRGKVLGKEHPDYAWILNNLANLYQAMGNYEKAELLYLESKAIREKALGNEHPDYAESLNNLAFLYWSKSNYEKAEPLYLESKAIREKVLGKEHPDYTESPKNLAILYWTMGNYEKAEPFFKELNLVNQSLAEKAVRHLSEREMGSYMNKFSEGQDGGLSFTQLSGSKKVVPTWYDNSLFYKGFLLQAAGQIKRLSLSDPAATEKLNLLKSYERRLAAQYAKPIAERTRVAELEAKTNEVEKDLARTVAGFGNAIRQVKWQEVQATLRSDEAAVEFVDYRFYKKKPTDSTMYAALLLLPGAESPIFVPLFEEKQLDAAINFTQKRRSEYANTLYQIASRSEETRSENDPETLRDLIWKPLEPHLSGVKTIHFSPSGLLHRINLAAIPLDSATTLGDRFQLVQLGSTRQLVVPGNTHFPGRDAMLFGGIFYDPDSTSARSFDTLRTETTSVTHRAELEFNMTDSTLRAAYRSPEGDARGGSWKYLKNTIREVAEARNILTANGFEAEIVAGQAASEEAFKQIGQQKPSPRVLHLATHGYFFPDPKTENRESKTESVFKMSDHPMIRSGLILAGANHAWKTGQPLRPGMEDGILTAYEISQMNLSGTELVVLSACETGLGDIRGNEGVFGLQRAFKIAGAKHLLMSLWQVPDKAKQELMTAFYQKWLGEGLPLREAFHAAQNELRARYPAPFYWAGFVLVE